ncbi:MAG: peptidase S16 [Actinomycetota bacterium]|nr:MAG: peptidase S16 [Actinomycetota bacterium]
MAPDEQVVLPLFPLRTVLVPGLVLPLHIFEPRYRTLVADLLARPEDQQRFGVVAIREGREVGPDGAKALYEVGTVAVVDRVDPHADGRFDLMAHGGPRFRLHSVESGRPYLQGTVSFLDETDGDRADELAAWVSQRFSDYRAAVLGAGDTGEQDEGPGLPAEPTLVSYLVGAAMVLDLTERQALLECPDTSARLRAELRLLRRETGLIAAVRSLPAPELARAPITLN